MLDNAQCAHVFDSSHDVEYTGLTSLSGCYCQQTLATLSRSSRQDPAMLRAHKIRLNPTPEQEIYFRKGAGTARFVFNWGLAEVKRALDAGEQPEHVLALKKRFNTIKRETFPWVYEVTKCAVEGGFVRLGAALANFLSSKRGE